MTQYKYSLKLQNTRTIRYQITDYVLEEVTIQEQEYLRVVLEDESNILAEGMQDLPSICKSITIPDTTKMDVKIISTEYELYENIRIAPSKGNLLRSVNPEDVPYQFGDIYDEDTWYPEQIVELGQPYILRDFRGQVVRVFPFQYNPVQQKLRVYSDISVEAYPTGIDTINCLTRDEPQRGIDPEFRSIYEGHFLDLGGGRYGPVEWKWANFTWQNSLIPLGTEVGWRIFFVDSNRNVNATDIMSFIIGEDTNNPPETPQNPSGRRWGPSDINLYHKYNGPRWR